MSAYIIYNADGDILRLIDMPDQAAAEAQVGEGEFILEGIALTHWKVDVATQAVIQLDEPELPQNTPIPEKPAYVQQRELFYPSIADQLDMLWHAMDAGEIPKASEWFDRIKFVKDLVPVGSEDIPTVISIIGEIEP